MGNMVSKISGGVALGSGVAWTYSGYRVHKWPTLNDDKRTALNALGVSSKLFKGSGSYFSKTDDYSDFHGDGQPTGKERWEEAQEKGGFGIRDVFAEPYYIASLEILPLEPKQLKGMTPEDVSRKEEAETKLACAIKSMQKEAYVFLFISPVTFVICFITMICSEIFWCGGEEFDGDSSTSNANSTSNSTNRGPTAAARTPAGDIDHRIGDIENQNLAMPKFNTEDNINQQPNPK
jgi:hypothetical protein